MNVRFFFYFLFLFSFWIFLIMMCGFVIFCSKRDQTKDENSIILNFYRNSTWNLYGSHASPFIGFFHNSNRIYTSINLIDKKMISHFSFPRFFFHFQRIFQNIHKSQFLFFLVFWINVSLLISPFPCFLSTLHLNVEFPDPWSLWFHSLNPLWCHLLQRSLLSRKCHDLHAYSEEASHRSEWHILWVARRPSIFAVLVLFQALLLIICISPRFMDMWPSILSTLTCQSKAECQTKSPCLHSQTSRVYRVMIACVCIRALPSSWKATTSLETPSRSVFRYDMSR